MDKQEWQPIETAPKDGTSVLLYIPHRICEGWFSKGEWSEDTPISPAEYSGEVWVCCDDEFQVEVELGPDGFECHFPITHWMPLPEPPKEGPSK